MQVKAKLLKEHIRKLKMKYNKTTSIQYNNVKMLKKLQESKSHYLHTI